MSYDPSRTTTLRRLFENAVKSRLNLFWQRLRDLLLVEDAFGIQEKKDEQRFSLSFNQRFFYPSNQFQDRGGESHSKIRRESLEKTSQKTEILGSDNDLLTANVRWRFLTESAQLEVFKRWLAEEIFQNVFDGLEDSAEDAYWYEFARKGFEKGQKRAFDQAMNRTWGSRAFKEGARAEFLRSSFYNPVSIDRVKVLASRNLTQLKNVTETMAKDILRELTDGLVQGKNPREIASHLMQTVGLSKWRSTVIARTEIIRAHGEGQLDTLEKLGMKTVSIAVEWSTAGDGRVCELCQPMQGVVLTIEEARGLIPRHPQCRCSYIPANLGETERTRVVAGVTIKVPQKKTKAAVDAALRESVKAEIPKSSKRSVETQRKQSKWVGAGLDVSAARPKNVFGVKSK